MEQNIEYLALIEGILNYSHGSCGRLEWSDNWMVSAALSPCLMPVVALCPPSCCVPDSSQLSDPWNLVSVVYAQDRNSRGECELCTFIASHALMQHSRVAVNCHLHISGCQLRSVNWNDYI